MSDMEKFVREDPWQNITSPVYPNGQRLYQKDERFWVSMDTSNRLVFFMREPGKYTIKKLPELNGLEITIDHDSIDGETMLVCTLTEPLLGDKFALVAKDVAFHSYKFEGDQFLEECKNRIISWGDFLKPSRRGLSKAEWIGFWGELYVLSQILTPSMEAADAVKFWIGPEGKKQDFTFNKSALEIKTTVSGDPSSIKISSLDQLHKITDRLFLMHLHINYSNDPIALSLQDMFVSMENILKDDIDAKTKFLNKSSPLYGKATEKQLEDKFNYLGMETYEIKDGFPSLTGETIASAITSVKYSLNPSSLKSYLIDINIEELLD